MSRNKTKDRAASVSTAEVASRALEGLISELNDREAHLQAILATVPDALIIIDEVGIIHLFSSAAERQFGYTADEARGRNVSMLMPSPHAEEHDAYLARYLATGERRMIGTGRVVVGKRKDGSTFPVELSVGEVILGDKRRFTGFVRDLTDRHDRDRRVHELQSELLHMSRLTTIGEMASAITHELNQPLAAISNYVEGCRELLKQDPSANAESIGNALEKAAIQALRAGEVIKRLRQFMAKGETQRRAESISKLAEEASALALVAAKERAIRVNFDFDPDSDLVVADKVQIQQVLLNLVRNAIEAMEASDRRELGVATGASAPDGMVTVSVSDTGKGVPAELRAKLFQPFVTTKQNGMGVGLSICRTIVESHGGHISAETLPTGGSRFTFTLRRAGANEGLAA